MAGSAILPFNFCIDCRRERGTLRHALGHIWTRSSAAEPDCLQHPTAFDAARHVVHGRLSDLAHDCPCLGPRLPPGTASLETASACAEPGASTSSTTSNSTVGLRVNRGESGPSPVTLFTTRLKEGQSMQKKAYTRFLGVYSVVRRVF